MASKHEKYVAELRDQIRALEQKNRDWQKHGESQDSKIATLTRERDTARSQVYEFGDAKRQLEDAHSAAAMLQQRLTETQAQVAHLLGWASAKADKRPFDPEFHPDFQEPYRRHPHNVDYEAVMRHGR